MVAILLFDLSEITLNKRPMSDSDQRAVFGSTFELLGQHRRVDVLSAYGLIDDEVKRSFDLIRTTRRRYLHLWSKQHNELPKDAVEVYHAAVTLAIYVIGQDVTDGKIVLKQAMVKYLEQTGDFKELEED